MATRAPRFLALAGLFLLLPAMACGQMRQPSQQTNARLSRPTTDMTLQDFTARRERRILAADTGGDGKVSRAEFLASATSGKGDPARRFGRFDRNGDGLIDRQEIAVMMARRFGKLDTDGDGVLTAAERTTARAATKQGDAES